MAKTLPLPANQVGSPCDSRSPASGKPRQNFRSRSTYGASLAEISRTGWERGFFGGGAERGTAFFLGRAIGVGFLMAKGSLDPLLLSLRVRSQDATSDAKPKCQIDFSMHTTPACEDLGRHACVGAVFHGGLFDPRQRLLILDRC